MQTISQRKLEDTMYYNQIPVFVYKIYYPYFTTSCHISTAQDINSYYAADARKTKVRCRTVLYSQAVANSRYIVKNTPPFNSYTFESVYTTTYNQNCVTSLFFDSYTYLGGAHGETFRKSDTWNFSNGNRMTLEDFYPKENSYINYFFQTIEQEIEKRLKTEPGSYFDNYPDLIRNTFKPENFFLTPEGIILYFQQYDIAPYSTGLPEFLLPFSTGK